MKFDDIKKEILECKKCELFKTKINYVPGDGNSKAKIMFVGEAPGKTEDEKGLPFVGRAGKIFDELLRSVELFRTDIFISNCLHCRPPNNREPTDGELLVCTPYLDKQIEIIKPKVLCPMGNFAMQFVFKKYGLEKPKGITVVHGKQFKVKNLFDDIIIIPLYHPAMATYNPETKITLLEDFKQLEKLK